jgi:hypothetical protein
MGLSIDFQGIFRDTFVSIYTFILYVLEGSALLMRSLYHDISFYHRRSRNTAHCDMLQFI